MTEGPPEYNADRALVPVDEKEVEFYGDVLVAVLVQEEDEPPTVYVPLKTIADNIGLDWSAQYRRVQRDPILSDVSQLIAVTAIKSQRGNPDALCLPLKFLPGWLFGVNANRVRDELREKVLRYQRECYDVLWEAFQEGRLTTGESFDAILHDADPELVQAYRQAQAIVRIARHQILMESRIDDHDRRLEALEDRLAPGNPITEDQATQLSQAVKAVAVALGKQTRRNEFGAIYGELYRRYGINSYKLLPAEKFEDAMSWLNQWLQDLISGDDAPF